MRKALGSTLLGLAAFFGFFELIALLDPVGTKMADDGDPFGPPAPWQVHAVWIAVISVLAVAGARLVMRRPRHLERRRSR